MSKNKSIMKCLLINLFAALHIPVNVYSRQEWVYQPVYTEVNPGGTVVLPCRVTNKKGECRWERNSLPVGAYAGKYEWAGTQADGDCSLEIRNIFMLASRIKGIPLTILLVPLADNLVIHYCL